MEINNNEDFGKIQSLQPIVNKMNEQMIEFLKSDIENKQYLLQIHEGTIGSLQRKVLELESKIRIAEDYSEKLEKELKLIRSRKSWIKCLFKKLKA